MNADATPPPPPIGAGETAGLPWERRDDGGGALTRLVETVRRILVEPAAAFAAARRRGELVSPLGYAVLLVLVGVLAERIWGLMIGTSLLELLPPQLRDNASLGFALSGIGFAATLVVVPVIALVALFVYAAIVHLFLMLYGATRHSECGYEGTVRALAWSTTSQLGQLVPFAGGLVVMVWGIVLQTMALASFHRTTPGRALAAVLTPLVLCCVCIAIFFAGALALIVGGLTSAGR